MGKEKPVTAIGGLRANSRTSAKKRNTMESILPKHAAKNDNLNFYLHKNNTAKKPESRNNPHVFAKSQTPKTYMPSG